MQNPYVKYLKTKNGYFYLFIMNTAIFSVAAFPMTAGQCRRKSRRKPLLFFPSANMKLSPICSIPAAKGSFIWHPLPILPTGSIAPCETAPPPPTAQGFSLLPSKEAFHIIYHLPTEATGVDSLVYSVFRNGQWEKPYQIDHFLSLKQTPFLARRLSDAHIILYYRTGRNVLSAREMLLIPLYHRQCHAADSEPPPLAPTSPSSTIPKESIFSILFAICSARRWSINISIPSPSVRRASSGRDTNCENMPCLSGKRQTDSHVDGKRTAISLYFRKRRCLLRRGGALYGKIPCLLHKRRAARRK